MQKISNARFRETDILKMCIRQIFIKNDLINIKKGLVNFFIRDSLSASTVDFVTV